MKVYAWAIKNGLAAFTAFFVVSMDNSAFGVTNQSPVVCEAKAVAHGDQKLKPFRVGIGSLQAFPVIENPSFRTAVKSKETVLPTTIDGPATDGYDIRDNRFSLATAHSSWSIETEQSRIKSNVFDVGGLWELKTSQGYATFGNPNERPEEQELRNRSALRIELGGKYEPYVSRDDGLGIRPLNALKWPLQRISLSVKPTGGNLANGGGAFFQCKIPF